MGRVIKREDIDMLTTQIDTEISRRLQAFVKGEMTWAEVEGMTWDEAKAIAQVG